MYHRNGIAYAMTRECLVDQRTIMGARAGAIIMEGEHISIDTERDMAVTELALSRTTAIGR